MKLKIRIQKWLEIEKPPQAIKPDMKDFETRFTKLEDRFNFFMTQYHPVFCKTCGSSMLAHYGGFYRTSDGFCLCKNCAGSQSGTALQDNK